MKFAKFALLPSMAVLAAIGVVGSGQFSATNVSTNSPCPDSAPNIYTDGGNNYVGICGGGAFAQVNNPNKALAGQQPLVEGQTGVAALDALVWAYGPASLYIAGQGTPSPNPGCAPAGDDTYVHSNGNNVTRELPTVYTDGGQHHVGICGGGAFIQVNDPQRAAAGKDPLLVGQTGQKPVDDALWAYGPASFYIAGQGSESPNPACAPKGDDTYVHSNGNNVTRELPTVYTDGGQHHVGICGGGSGLQVNGNPANPVVVSGGPAVPTLP